MRKYSKKNIFFSIKCLPTAAYSYLVAYLKGSVISLKTTGRKDVFLNSIVGVPVKELFYKIPSNALNNLADDLILNSISQ